jgi:hypothetical protein
VPEREPDEMPENVLEDDTAHGAVSMQPGAPVPARSPFNPAANQSLGTAPRPDAPPPRDGDHLL